MMRTATVSFLPRHPALPASLGLRLATLTAVTVLVCTAALAAQQPDETKPGVRPPLDVGRTAAKAAELRAVLVQIRQERKAGQSAAASWRREKAELEDELAAVTEDRERLDAGREPLRVRLAALEARTKTARHAAAVAAGRDLALRSRLVRTFAWMYALNASGLPVGRDARRERIVSLWRDAVRGETPISTAASSLFGQAFRWLGDSRTCEAADAVIRGGVAADRRAVEVLRIGLVNAIAMPPDGGEVHTIELNDRGRPVWSPPVARPGLIERVRDGLEILRRRRTPEVITLPVADWASSTPAPPVPDAEMPVPPKARPPERPGNEGKESHP